MRTLKIFHKYRSDFRANLKLAYPIMIGQLGQVIVYVSDNVMVGRLGPTELAAVSLGIAVFAIFFVVGMGISFALPPLIAEADGAEEHHTISPWFKHSTIINILYAIFTIFAIEAIIPLLSYLGQQPDVLNLAIPYLRVSAYSMIPFMLFQSCKSLSEGLSKTTLPMIAMVLGNIVNIVFNYMLIYGKWGAPMWGVYGAAIASLVAKIVMMVSLVVLIYNYKVMWQYISNVQWNKYQSSLFIKLFDLGVPTSLQMLFEILIFSGSALLIGRIGAEELAAHQIALNLVSISFMTCVGLSVAATIRIGNQLGRKEYQAMQVTGYAALIQTVGFMSLAGVFFVSTRFFLPSLYIDNAPVIDMAAQLLILASIFQIPDGIQAVSIGALRGVQDIKIPALITFIAYVIVGLPLAYYCAFIMQLGAPGVWIGLVAGLTVSAVGNTWRFRYITSRLLQ